MDLYDLARTMINKALIDDGTNVIESPAITKNQAEKLAGDYLAAFNARKVAINPQMPNISSYFVAISGGQVNA